MTDRRRPLLLGAAALGLLLSALDMYVVVTLLPGMLYDLDLSVDHIEQATPIVSGFLAGYVMVMPLVGLAADAYGRALAFVVALSLFASGSLLTATAAWSGEPPYGVYGLPWLVIGRSLQGLGGGAMVPVALALAADLYPAPAARERAIGAVSAVQEVGAVLGPLYGAGLAGLASAFGGWRAVFWANLPLAGLIGVGFLAAYKRSGRAYSPPPNEPPTRGARGEIESVDSLRPDWLGAACLGGGLALVVVALYPDRPATAAVGSLFLPAGLAALLLLAAWAWRQARGLAPLIPPALLRSRRFLGASLANLLAGGGLMVALVDVPVEGRGVFDLDQLGAALLLARFMVAVPAGALAGGFLSSRLGRRPTAVSGLLLAAAGFGLISGWDAAELSRQSGLLRSADLELLLTGFGFGLIIAPLAATVIDLAAPARHGLAASLVVLVRTLGMLLCLSLLTAYGVHRFYQLIDSGPALRLIPGSPDFAAQKHLYELRVSAALVAEYHGVFLVAAGLCIVAAFLAALSLSARRTAGTTTRSM